MFAAPVSEPIPDPVRTPEFCTHEFNFDGPYFAGTQIPAPFGQIIDGDLVIDTDDTSLNGEVIDIDVEYTPNGPNSVGTNTITYQVSFNACTVNTVLVDPPIQDFDYTSIEGPITKEGSFISEFPGCICEYKLEQLDWFGSGDFDADSFGHDSSSPIVTIHIPINRQLGDYTLVLSAIACDGESSTEDEFVVTFKDAIVDCSLATVTQAEVPSNGVFELWIYEENQIEFNVATVDAEFEECAMIYTLCSDSGDEIDETFYQIQSDPNNAVILLTINDPTYV